MSCIAAGVVTHFRITKVNGVYYIVKGDTFPTIQLLVDSLIDVGFVSKGKFIKVTPITHGGGGGARAAPPVPATARPTVAPAVPNTPRPASMNLDSAPPVPTTSRPTKSTTLPKHATMQPVQSKTSTLPKGPAQPQADASSSYGQVVQRSAPAADPVAPVASPTTTYGQAVSRTGDLPPPNQQAPPQEAYGAPVQRGVPLPQAFDSEEDYCDVRVEMPVSATLRKQRRAPAPLPAVAPPAAATTTSTRMPLPATPAEPRQEYENLKPDALPPMKERSPVAAAAVSESLYMNMAGNQPLGSAGAPSGPATISESTPAVHEEEDYTCLAAPGTFHRGNGTEMYVNHSVIQSQQQ
eukprot:TRINITY_DN675_c0_g1_i1.p1 TRINITY_DN675_c0_g1~~TRINITY_DN675_c0_g1_i1.p1  ORF type:complete len:404 (+),score=71.55 TRINITY_DN675_c0_g1_i1:159-1214(+)